MVIGRSRYHYIYLITLYQRTESFLKTRLGLTVAVCQTTAVDINDLALALLLTVINPADDRDHTIEKTLVVHTVGTMEMSSLRIMTAIEIPGMHKIVLIAEEPPHTLPLLCLLLRCHRLKAREALFSDLLIFFLQSFRNHKLRLAILARVLPRLFTRQAMLLHRRSHLEGGIDADAVEAIEHLRIHTTHRGTDDQVRFLLLCFLF